MRPLFILLALLTALSGCASRDPIAARQKAYEHLASFIEPGMTRRQLYALLPPRRPAMLGRTPQDFAPNPESVLISIIHFRSGLKETYPLDRDFAVNVSYTPKSSQIPEGNPFGSKPVRVGAVDNLLFGISRPPKPAFSKQNPDDEIYECPRIVRTPSAGRDLLLNQANVSDLSTRDLFFGKAGTVPQIDSKYYPFQDGIKPTGGASNHPPVKPRPR